MARMLSLPLNVVRSNVVVSRNRDLCDLELMSDGSDDVVGQDPRV